MRTAKRWRGAAALVLLCGLGALLGARLPVAPAGPTRGQVHVAWLGHACFLTMSPGGTQLLIDPWIKGNPATPDSL
jgi:hypothetical protein